VYSEAKFDEHNLPHVGRNKKLKETKTKNASAQVPT